MSNPTPKVEFSKSLKTAVDELSSESESEVEEEAVVVARAAQIVDRLSDNDDNDPYVCRECELRHNDALESDQECDHCAPRKRRKFTHLVFKNSAPPKKSKRFRVAQATPASIPASSSASSSSVAAPDEADDCSHDSGDDEPYGGESMRETDLAYYIEQFHSDVDEDEQEFIDDGDMMNDYENVLDIQSSTVAAELLPSILLLELVEVVREYIIGTPATDEEERKKLNKQYYFLKKDEQKTSAPKKETRREYILRREKEVVGYKEALAEFKRERREEEAGEDRSAEENSGDDSDDDRLEDPTKCEPQLLRSQYSSLAECKNVNWRDNPDFSKNNARAAFLNHQINDLVSAENELAGNERGSAAASTRTVPPEASLEKLEEYRDDLEDTHAEEALDLAWADLEMELDVFMALETHRRHTQVVKEEEEDGSMDIRISILTEELSESTVSYNTMKHKPTIQMIQEVGLDLASKVSHNGTVVPQLFRWGYLIAVDALILAVIRDDECSYGGSAIDKWVKTHEHTRLEFMRGITPLLREINKRIVVLTGWKELELEYRSLAEIRKEQTTTEPIVPKENWERLVREVANDYKYDLEFEPDALAALQEAAEAYLVSLFQGSNRAAIHAGRTHITVPDMQLVKALREDK